MCSLVNIAANRSRAKRIKIREMSPWADLPQDILVSIYNKLCFTYQVRLRSVCTSWRLSPDVIQCSYRLPWVILYSESFSKVDHVGKLFDPYSRQVYEIDFSDQNYPSSPFDYVIVCASKNGWILLCDLETGSSLFLRNPFAIRVIFLPELLSYICRAATFTTNPNSPECEFLVLCNPCPRDNVERLYIARLCLSKSKEWSIQYLEQDAGDYSVHYMEGKLYCLGFEGILKIYNLEDKSWKLLTSFLPTLDHHDGYWSWKRGSLVENDGDLIMVCMFQNLTYTYYKSCPCEWLIFRFDLSEMTWVVQQDLRNTAFFVSGRVSFSAPLIHVNGEKVEDCLLFDLEEDSCGVDESFECYSFKERKCVESKIYTWIGRCYDRMIFIEPPYLWVTAQPCED